MRVLANLYCNAKTYERKVLTVIYFLDKHINIKIAKRGKCTAMRKHGVQFYICT